MSEDQPDYVVKHTSISVEKHARVMKANKAMRALLTRVLDEVSRATYSFTLVIPRGLRDDIGRFLKENPNG